MPWLFSVDEMGCWEASVPLKAILFLGKAENHQPWNCFLSGSFSLESKQEWCALESFYLLGFSGGTFFQNRDFGEKKCHRSARLK